MAIVGGGPGGLAAANALLQAVDGIKVKVITKHGNEPVTDSGSVCGWRTYN